MNSFHFFNRFLNPKDLAQVRFLSFRELNFILIHITNHSPLFKFMIFFFSLYTLKFSVQLIHIFFKDRLRCIINFDQ